MIKRRQFIINSGLALGALAISPTFAFNNKNKNIGLQLYTLRDSFSKNVSGVLEEVSKVGYNEVETYGFSVKDNGFFGTSTKDFKTILNNNGLKATSGHYDLTNFLRDGDTDLLKSTIEAAQFLGNDCIVVPAIGDDMRKNIDDYKKVAQKLNEAGVLCKNAGMKMGYHNHDFEFKDFGDANGYETLLSETDKNVVDFEMDLYWVVRAGKNPLEYFKKYPGRFTMWHVKDMDKKDRSLNTEIGNGSIDFKAIFANAKLSGMKRFFVEQENNYVPNPLGAVATDYNYIKNSLI